jgi:hypothetical protein
VVQVLCFLAEHADEVLMIRNAAWRRHVARRGDGCV